MSEERQERCERCRFWGPPDTLEEELGTCLRYPPWPLLLEGSDVWPESARDDWCGEFVPAETRAEDAFVR